MKQDAASFQNPAAHSLPGSASEQAGESEEEPPGTTACPENVVPLPDIAPRTHGNVAVFPVPKSRPSLSTRANVFRRTFFPTATEKDWNDWQWQIRNRIRHLDQLERMLSLSHPERSAVEMIQSMLPVGITPYYMSLLVPGRRLRPAAPDGGPDDGRVHDRPRRGGRSAGRRRAQPGAGPGAPLSRPRAAAGDWTSARPTAATAPARGWSATAHIVPEPNRAWNRRIDYIRATPAIRDVLISGGDPLALSDERLDWILAAARRSRTSSSSASARRCRPCCRSGSRPSCAACCASTIRSG